MPRDLHAIEEVCTLISKYGGFAAARKRAEDAVAGASAMLTVFTDKTCQF